MNHKEELERAWQAGRSFGKKEGGYYNQIHTFKQFYYENYEKPLIPRVLYYETSSKEDGFKTMETILNSLPKDVRITKPKSEHVIDKEYRGDILCGYKPFPYDLFIFKVEFLVNKTFDLDECLKGIQL